MVTGSSIVSWLNQYRWQLGIIGLALLLRLWLIAVASGPLQGDARDYHVLAKNLWAGHGYQQLYRGESPEFTGITWQAYRSPGYPLLLAAVGMLHEEGPQKSDAYWVNVVAEMALLISIMLLSGWWFGRAGSYLSGSLCALLPLWSVQGGTESVFMALIALAFVLVSLTRSPLVCGLLLCAATFVRPIGIIFFVPAFLILRHYRRSAQITTRIGVLFIPLILTGTLWTVRNLTVFGEPILLTTNGPLHALIDSGVDRSALVAAVRADGGGELELYRAAKGALWKRLATMSLAEHATLFWQRLSGLVSTAPPHELRAIQWRFTLEPSSAQVQLLRWLILLVPVSYLFALAGLIRGWNHPAVRGIALSMGFFAISHSLVSRGDLRLGWPLVILSILLAAAVVSIPREQA